MDPEALTTLLAYGIAVVLGGLLLCLGALYFVGWAGRRAGCRGGITVIAQMLTPVALVFVGSLYLDVAGAIATGRLESKDERILYGSPRFWSRAFFATVAFESQTGPAKALLWLDEATFDALTLALGPRRVALCACRSNRACHCRGCRGCRVSRWPRGWCTSTSQLPRRRSPQRTPARTPNVPLA